MNDLAILMITCDKYSFIWESWYYYFKKNFPPTDKLYWTNETIDCPYPEFKQIKVDIKDPNKWTKRVRLAVKQIPEKNILILLDDLLIVKPIDELKIIYNYFQLLNMDSLIILPVLSKNLKFESIFFKDLLRLKKYSWYLFSSSPTIYKKKFLLECLRPTYSIWDAEIKGTKWLWAKAFFGREYKVYNYTKDWVFNSVKRGKVVDERYII
jgi:hypothetical protein